MHTSGPWRIGFKDGSGGFEHREGAWITTDSNEVIVQGGEDCGVPIGVRKPEDARLIASAPKLFDLLEKAMSYSVGALGPRWYEEVGKAIKQVKGE